MTATSRISNAAMILPLILIVIPGTKCILPTGFTPTDNLRLVTPSSSPSFKNCVEILPPTLPTGEESNRSEKFLVDGLDNCIDYCMFTSQCIAIAYSERANLNNRTCVLLYSEYVYPEDKRHVDIFVRKSCILVKNSANRLKKEQLDGSEVSENGVEIVGRSSLYCLKLGKFDNGTTVMTKRAKVFWTNCPAFGRWKFQSLASPHAYRISTFIRPTMCLEFNEKARDVFLNECGDNVRQIFHLSNYGISKRQFRLIGTVPVSRVRVNRLRIPKTALKEVNFPVIYFLKGYEKPLSLKNLAWPDSTFLNPQKVPFFLPTTPVTVKCNDGFVLYGNKTSQEILPTKNLKLPPCLAKEKRTSGIELKTWSLVKFLVICLLYLQGCVF